jgi:hypothetical protein
MIDLLTAFLWIAVGLIWLLTNIARLVISPESRNRWINLIFPPLSLTSGVVCLNFYWKLYESGHHIDFDVQPPISWELGSTVLGLLLPPVVAFSIHRFTRMKLDKSPSRTL